ncbi:MAG: hypothetical protein V4659_00505, partial [Pseudomonadota bacterium]
VQVALDRADGERPQSRAAHERAGHEWQAEARRMFLDGYEAVARVTIRQGQVAARTARVAPPSLKPVSAELGDSLRSIADPELKAVLSALAAGIETKRDIPVIGKVS